MNEETLAKLARAFGASVGATYPDDNSSVYEYVTYATFKDALSAASFARTMDEMTVVLSHAITLLTDPVQATIHWNRCMHHGPCLADCICPCDKCPEGSAK